MPFPSSVTGTSPRWGWHRLGAAVLMLGVSLLWGLLATPTHAASPTAAAASQPPHEPGVLIVAGNQHGLPVPEALINGAVSVLKAKGVSPSNIYVEHMDLDRFSQADTVAAWAALMHQKYASKRIGLVFAQDQASLEFLAQAGYDLLPPGQPVVATLIVKPEVTWRGAPHRILNVSELRDLAGTLQEPVVADRMQDRAVRIGQRDDAVGRHDLLEQHLDLSRCKHRGRFVENQQVRFMDQRATQAEFLLHPTGELARRALAKGRQAGAAQQVVDARSAFGGALAEQAAEEVEVLHH